MLKLQRLPLRASRGLRCLARPTLLVCLDGEEVPDLGEFFFFFFFFGFRSRGRRRRFEKKEVSRFFCSPVSFVVDQLTLSIIPRLLALLLILTVRSLLRRPRPSVTTALCDSRTPASPRRSVTKSERMGGGGADPGIFSVLFSFSGVVRR